MLWWVHDVCIVLACLWWIFLMRLIKVGRPHLDVGDAILWAYVPERVRKKKIAEHQCSSLSTLWLQVQFDQLPQASTTMPSWPWWTVLSRYNNSSWYKVNTWCIPLFQTWHFYCLVDFHGLKIFKAASFLLCTWENYSADRIKDLANTSHSTNGRAKT